MSPIRLAKATDRPIFAAFWRVHLEEDESLGSPWEAKNRLVGQLQLFSSYLEGHLFGFTLLAEEEGDPVGVLMWGEDWTGTNTNKWGKIARFWGFYVDPDSRQKGYVKAMVRTAKTMATEMGFQTVTTTVLNGSELVADEGKVVEGFRLHSTILVMDLGET